MLGVLARGVLGLFTRTFDFRTGRAGRAWVNFSPMSGYNGDAANIKGVDDSTGGGAGLTLSEDDGALRIRGDLTDAIENGEIHLHEGHSCADSGDHYAKDFAVTPPAWASWLTPSPTPAPARKLYFTRGASTPSTRCLLD